MATFQMQCPICNAPLMVDETWVGAPVVCPTCNSTVVVPPNKSTASLVLGILGLVFFMGCIGWILSLIGLIIGCKKKYKTGIILGGIGLGINLLGTIILAAAVLLPAMSTARENARRASCQNNLKMIGSTMLMYAIDYDVFPYPAKGDDGMDLLRDDYYMMDSKTFECPSASDSSAPSYAYLGEGVAAYGEIIPIVIEHPKNHDQTINVLYSNGSVLTRIIPHSTDTVSEALDYLLSDSSVSEDMRAKLIKNAEKYD